MKKPHDRFGIGPTIASIRRLVGHMRGYRVRFFAGLAVYAFASELAFNLLFTLSFLQVLAAGETGDVDLLVKGIGFISIGFLTVVILFATGQLLYDTAVARASGDLRRRVFGHFTRLPFRWYERNHSGEAASRLTTDMQEAEKAWGEPLRNVVSTLLSGLGSVVVLFILDWRFALIIIPLGLVMFLLTTRFIAPVRERSNEVQEAQAQLSKQVIDLLGSSAVVRLFNMSPWLASGIEATVDRLFRISMRRARWTTAQEGVNTFAGVVTSIGGILLGTVFVMNGWFPASRMVAMVQMSNGINSMFWALGARLTALQHSLAGADRVLDVLEMEPEDTTHACDVTTDERTVASVQGLKFAYDDTPVLKDISLEIGKGEMVALVGGSGGGKSTLIKLLNGFYDANADQLAMSKAYSGGLDPRRRNIAYVPQNTYLFSGTIGENIGYGRPGATEDDIQAAAELARAHEFISELPEGYATRVGERGSQLSGGQRQRIAIARALLKNAELILLDEATSSLDSRSERLMQEAIDRAVEDRTAVVVAHRLSTVERADKIFVMEDGVIVESGDHASLMAKQGRYAYYYDMQFA